MCRIGVAAALVCQAGSSVAEACGVLIVKHATDAAERQVDRQPPAQVAGTVVRVLRGRRGAGSCNDVGSVEIAITGAKDDRTPAERIGYRLTHVAGTLPEGLFLENHGTRLLPRRADDASRDVFSLQLAWTDRATGDQPGIDFTVTITAVDLAGHESAPSAPIRVRHPLPGPAVLTFPATLDWNGGGKPDR